MYALARLFACLALASSWSAVAQTVVSAPAPPAAPTLLPEIPYTTDPTGTYRGDLYRPATSKPAPVIVMIHGGSWRSGNKREFRRLGADLAAQGYACFSIDYDLHPHSFPYSWQEARAAVQFLRAHAAEYSIDPAHIAVLGTSAGGQLAALLALAPEGPISPAAPAPTVPIAAAVVFNGVYNLHLNAYVVRRFLGDRCERIAEVCTAASPEDHVHPGAPPFFVGHGTSDFIVSYRQATDFTARLQAAGDAVTPFRATGAGHSYWRGRKWYAANLAATEAFLAANMPSVP